MSCSLGISTGSSGVYSALVDTDTSTNAPGAVPAETRFVSADQANSNVGDLVRASIKLMTTQVTDGSEAPSSIGVSYRTDDQLASIRSSLSRSPKQVRAIPEPAAVHAYLAETGKTERYDTTAQVDVGDQGLTVSVVDHTGEVLHSDRIDALAGAGIDRALVDFVTEKAPGHLRRYTDAELLAARCHVAKEQLSTSTKVTIDLPIDAMAITRDEFEAIIAPDIERAVTFIREVVKGSPRPVGAVVLIGGGAHIPAVRSAVAAAVDVPMVEIVEPETAATKGAALLADSITAIRFPLLGSGSDQRSGSTAKVSGALIGALVVGGLVLGYGAKELVPTDDTAVSPVGTGSTTTTVSPEATPSTGSTIIPSHDPLPSVAGSTYPRYGYPTTPFDSQPYDTHSYTTHQYTLPPAPIPDTSTTTTPPTTTTTTPNWPTIPGITLPDPPAWWPTLPDTEATPPVDPTEANPGGGLGPGESGGENPTTPETPGSGSTETEITTPGGGDPTTKPGEPNTSMPENGPATTPDREPAPVG